MGQVKNTAVVIAQTLQKMKRYVGTKYGISKKYIKTNLKELRKRLFGTGQGSGCGPAVWLCHLVVLFEILEKKCREPIFTSPSKDMEFTSGGTGYVDDVTLVTQVQEKN